MKRKQNRIPNFDYSQSSAYFLTICTKNRMNLFWSVGATCGRPQMPLSPLGKMVWKEIEKIPAIYPAVFVDLFCVMPDHVHMLIRIGTDVEGRPQVAPTVSRIIQQFKGKISKQAKYPVWQKSFYDHVIRNEADYRMICQYIENNPLKWKLDELYQRERE